MRMNSVGVPFKDDAKSEAPRIGFLGVEEPNQDDLIADLCERGLLHYATADLKRVIYRPSLAKACLRLMQTGLAPALSRSGMMS